RAQHICSTAASYRSSRSCPIESRRVSAPAAGGLRRRTGDSRRRHGRRTFNGSYLQRRKPVIPLDLPLGAGRADGTGGALRLSKEARSYPARFFRFDPAFANTEGAALATIATRNTTVAPADISTGISELLAKLARPTAVFAQAGADK